MPSLPSEDVARLLEAIVERYGRRRIDHLNLIAEGRGTDDDSRRVVMAEGKIQACLENIAVGTWVKRVRVVEAGAALETRDHRLPRDLREAYDMLCLKVYGTEPAVSVGNADVKTGIGKYVHRTSSGQKEGVMPGARASTKKHGAALRQVIKDRRAYEDKQKIDRRLRALGRELRMMLSSDRAAVTVGKCSKCRKLGDDDWAFCPRCGGKMIKEER